MTFCQISGQKSPENIYRKYSQNSDYTTIFISGGIMKLINHFEDDDTLEAVSSIRIIAQNNESRRDDSFYEEIVESLDKRDYEELIRVKEYHNNVLVLTKDDGEYIYELLVIVGGEDNAFIQIKGKLSFEEAEKMTANLNVDAFVSMN